MMQFQNVEHLVRHCFQHRKQSPVRIPRDIDMMILLLEPVLAAPLMRARHTKHNIFSRREVPGIKWLRSPQEAIGVRQNVRGQFQGHLTGSCDLRYGYGVEGQLSTSITSPLHKAAREFALAGIAVFPCQPQSKVPATEHGWHDATTDLPQIDAWWTADPHYNIALNPHSAGWGVIDIDGPEGEAALATLEKEQGALPLTYEVRTPRGGRHLYFDGELPMTAWRPGVKRCLGEHLDTRGVGSYVLVPPSFVHDPVKGISGGYEVTHDRDFANVPGWVQTRLAQRTERVSAASSELDTGASRDRAQSLLHDLVRRGDVAVEGRGGNNRTYQLACEVLNLGISPELCGTLLEEIWNPHCVPPWSSDELAALISNASNYSQNEVGAWAVAPAEEVFAGTVLDQLVQAPSQPERRSRFYFEDDKEQDNAPDPTWLISDLIPDRATVLLSGSTGSFKSFIAQEVSLAVAAGVETFGAKPLRSGSVFYGAHEGRNEIKKPRKNAWKAAREVSGTLPFYVAPAPQVAVAEQCEDFRAQIRARLTEPGQQRIALIILDTVAKCMIGLDENSVRDCGIFTAFVDSLRDEFECSVLALHHFGKDSERGGRGSSALPANFDTIIHVKREPETKAVAVKVMQHKDADERREPWTFEGKVVGPSLVFFPTSLDEHKILTGDVDEFEPRKVGAALKKLDAFGQDNGVTSTVLAAELVQPIENESVDGRQERVQKASRALVSLARGKLEAYAIRAGRDLRWFLPAPTSDE